jgi:hypothetical protein
MRSAFIFHGIGGSPGENWFPWLRHALQQEGLSVTVPRFPTTRPVTTFAQWWDVFAPFLDTVDEQSLLIGHSLGVAFLLSVLERTSADAAFCVAPAWGVTGSMFDPIMRDIADRPFDWPTICEHCAHVEIFHAPNDPYVKMERAETLAQHLHGTLTVVPDAGHFNTSAGYEEFPLLLERVLQRIS